jgi:multidrug efflux system outer membrane protein
MRHKVLLWPLLAAAAVLAAGCLKVGPDYARPQAPASRESFQQPAGGAYEPADRWWQDYGDPRLDRLVRRALEHNPDIAEAAARVLERRALFVESEGARLPQLDLSGQASKQQSALATTSPAARFLQRRYEQYQLSAAASFEVDLWGRLARLEEAARADLLAAEHNRRTVVQTIIAGVVSSYLAVESLERRLAVAEKSVEAYRESLELVQSRYRRGLVSVLDLHQARRALASARSQIPNLRLELGRQQQKLLILAGSYPDTRPARAQPEDYFPSLKPVPAGLPSELLQRRPDVAAAEERLKAATARVGSAKAARFPALRLTGSYGFSSQELDQLTDPGSELYSLAAGIAAPLFRGGQLAARQRAAEARAAAAAAAWAKAVLAAFQEVEEALLVRQELARRRELVREALTQAVATQETALSRYQRGLTDYLRVLEATQARYQLADTLVQVELGLLTNRVTLHRALGGGWGRTAGQAKEAT